MTSSRLAVALLSNVHKPNQHRESKMKKQRHMFQTKQQGNTPKTGLNKTEMSDLHDKEFKIMVINMFSKVKRTMNEQSENFTNELLRAYQTHQELKITISKLKKLNRSVQYQTRSNRKKRISKLKDRVVEFIQIRGTNKQKKESK